MRIALELEAGRLRVMSSIIKRKRLYVRVRCIVIDEPRGTILVQEDTKTKTISLPGGRVEVGEPLPLCAVRELKEEAGIEVKPVRMVYVVDNISEDRSLRHDVMVYFKCEYEGAAPIIHEKRLGDAILKWVVIDEISDRFYPRPLARYLIRDYPNYSNKIFLTIKNDEEVFILD